MSNQHPSSRIAIKFNTTSSSSSSRHHNSRASPPPPPPRSSLGKHPRDDSRTNAFAPAAQRRQRSTFSRGGARNEEYDHDDDFISGDEAEEGRHEAITTLGGDDDDEAGRVSVVRSGAKVITRQKDQGWRAQMRARQGARAREPEDGERGKKSEVKEEAKKIKLSRDDGDDDGETQWGLVITKKKPPPPAEVADIKPLSPPPASVTKAGKIPPRSVDDEALAALLSNEDSKKSLATISAPGADDDPTADEATLDDYKSMPVEEFGAALLRGMGWDGELGPSRKDPVRRPPGLGLGGKIPPKGSAEEAALLGAWDNKAGKQQGGQQGQQKQRPPRVADYRREEMKRREERSRGKDSYKRERERERERERDRYVRDGGRR
jgi:hypothetical protein